MVEMVARENDKQLAGLFVFFFCFFCSFLFGGLCLTFWERHRPFVVIFTLSGGKAELLRAKDSVAPI